MSTRALIHIYEGGRLLCTLYRHCDGCPAAPGVGDKLVALVAKHPIINGEAGPDWDPPNAINGSGKMASLIICTIDNLDLRAPHADGCGEMYVYKVYLPSVGEVEASTHRHNTGRGYKKPYLYGYVRMFTVKYWQDSDGRAQYNEPAYLVPYDRAEEAE